MDTKNTGEGQPTLPNTCQVWVVDARYRQKCFASLKVFDIWAGKCATRQIELYLRKQRLAAFPTRNNLTLTHKSFPKCPFAMRLKHSQFRSAHLKLCQPVRPVVYSVLSPSANQKQCTEMAATPSIQYASIKTSLCYNRIAEVILKTCRSYLSSAAEQATRQRLRP